MVLTLYIDAITIVCCVSLIMLFFHLPVLQSFLAGQTFEEVGFGEC